MCTSVLTYLTIRYGESVKFHPEVVHFMYQYLTENTFSVTDEACKPFRMMFIFSDDFVILRKKKLGKPVFSNYYNKWKISKLNKGIFKHKIGNKREKTDLCTTASKHAVATSYVQMSVSRMYIQYPNAVFEVVYTYEQLQQALYKNLSEVILLNKMFIWTKNDYWLSRVCT